MTPNRKTSHGFLAGALFLCGIVIFGINEPYVVSYFLGSDYRRFMDKDSDYYAQIARDCDSVLQQNSIGSSNLSHDAVWPFLWKLSPQETSLPETIRDLEPNEIIISTNQISVYFGVSRSGWGIIWKQDENQTNIWRLETDSEGLTRIVYSKTNDFLRAN